ncbi:MAG: hypothetical protein ACRD4B_08405 [Acidobacteriota bacterium]
MTGPIGHGKTSFSDALAELEPSNCHFETNQPIIEVANALHAALSTIPDPYDANALNVWLQALPAILLEATGTKCTFEQLQLEQDMIAMHPIDYQKLILHVENLQRNPDMAKQPINKINKDNYRPFLQWLGGYLVQKVDPGIWVNDIIRRVKEAAREGCQLCIIGGLRFPTDASLLRDEGAKIVKVYRPGHLQNDMLDPTERERDNILVDATIMSNGSIEELKRCAAKFLEDLKSDSLQKLYQSKKA